MNKYKVIIKMEEGSTEYEVVNDRAFNITEIDTDTDIENGIKVLVFVVECGSVVDLTCIKFTDEDGKFYVFNDVMVYGQSGVYGGDPECISMELFTPIEVEVKNYSFGMGQIYKNRFVEVIVPLDSDHKYDSYIAARDIMQEAHGSIWSFEYYEQEWFKKSGNDITIAQKYNWHKLCTMRMTKKDIYVTTA